MTNTTEYEQRQDLIDASGYRDNDFYMGSMMRVHLCSMLNIKYTIDGGNRTTEGIKAAPRELIAGAHQHFKSFISYMHDHPHTICPCCGTSVRTSQITETMQKQKRTPAGGGIDDGPIYRHKGGGKSD